MFVIKYSFLLLKWVYFLQLDLSILNQVQLPDCFNYVLKNHKQSKQLWQFKNNWNKWQKISKIIRKEEPIRRIEKKEEDELTQQKKKGQAKGAKGK